MGRDEGGGPTDEELMVRVRADDSVAFAELYRRHVDRAFRVAQAVGLDAGRAERAIDAGFAAMWRSRADFRPDLGGFRAWAMTIVQNQARDTAAGRSVGRTKDRLSRLPEPLADIMALALHGELGHEEISTYLDLVEPPIEGRMRLAAASA